MAPVDPILIRLRAALDRTYGSRIERVVLFGSRARGDAGPDSDYDVAVFLKDFVVQDRHREIKTLADMTTRIVEETGELVAALPYPAGSYAERTPLMHEIREDGRDL